MEQKKAFFMPAPRPASRISPEDAKRLVDGSADLGFDRVSGGSSRSALIDDLAEPAAVKPQAFSVPETAMAPVSVPTAKLGAKAEKRAKIEKGRAPRPVFEPSVGVFAQTLRVDVPDELWTALKMASIQRKTSVKYLMLEALEKAGYPVDLDAIPEDGRRLR